MNLENLEALLLDRALGELPPEVAELLDEYLAQNPTAAQHAGTLDSTVNAARTAVAPSAVAPLPPLAVLRLRREQQAMRWRSRAWEFGRLAACLALGLVLGWAGRPVRTAPPMAELPVGVAVATLDPPAPAVSTPGFWSVSTLVAEQRARTSAAARRESRYELRWETPLKMPRVEEKL
jgi:anti-sigma factor RsiW